MNSFLIVVVIVVAGLFFSLVGLSENKERIHEQIRHRK